VRPLQDWSDIRSSQRSRWSAQARPPASTGIAFTKEGLVTGRKGGEQEGTLQAPCIKRHWSCRMLQILIGVLFALLLFPPLLLLLRLNGCSRKQELHICGGITAWLLLEAMAMLSNKRRTSLLPLFLLNHLHAPTPEQKSGG